MGDLMPFKEQLEKDMKAFFNADEFAETHSINGEPIACVLMLSNKDTDATIQSKKGTITSYSSISVQTSYINMPVPGDYLEVDSELFTVVEAADVEGMAYIDLSKPIGKFNRPITIQSFTTEKVNGIKKEVWTNVHECMAYIRHVSAEEMVQRRTILSKDTLFIKMHYVEGITSKNRLVYKDKFYNIVSVDNLEEKNVFLDLICEGCD
nr:phage head closure protein [uncultured Cellulosilyticum sp.]